MAKKQQNKVETKRKFVDNKQVEVKKATLQKPFTLNPMLAYGILIIAVLVAFMGGFGNRMLN